jgi:hypothetical protein
VFLLTGKNPIAESIDLFLVVELAYPKKTGLGSGEETTPTAHCG